MRFSEYSSSDFRTQSILDAEPAITRPPVAPAETVTREPTLHLTPPPREPVKPGAFTLEKQLLARMGFGKPLVYRAAENAEKNGTDIEQELLADSSVSSHIYYEALAEILDVPFLEEIAPEWVSYSDGLDTQLVDTLMVRVNRPRQSPLVAMAPRLSHLAALAEHCGQSPAFRGAIAVAQPSVIRNAIWKAGESRRIAKATNQLFDERPAFSARVTVSGKQGFAAGLFLSSLAISLYMALPPTLVILHLTLTLIYLCSLLMRMIALRVEPFRLPDMTLSGPLPVYTVLVALYREEQLVPQLVQALERINWPAPRLDIKLVCEADDEPTIKAVRNYATGSQFEVIEVPPSFPRTKPKALTYALPSVRGEYLVIYDAEDRPNPDQLREAYCRFQQSPPDIACFQAPLVISNSLSSWMTALFALEYAALFRGLLPMLARHRLPLPLGGTSNHFRVDALKTAGGWDPFNVTEDADLGMRLSRMGWRCGVLNLPTLEDAPEKLSVWTKQRSRWYKGWMQTLLVHFREPIHLVREIGAMPAAVFLLTVGGMLFSALAHPFLLATVTITLATAINMGLENIDIWERTLFLMDSANLGGSYLVFVILGQKPMLKTERRRLGRRWLASPLYWLMISQAAWRSLAELFTRPHFWHKTPHQPATPDNPPASD